MFDFDSLVSHMIIRFSLVDDVTICKIYVEIFGDVEFILVYDK